MHKAVFPFSTKASPLRGCLSCLTGACTAQGRDLRFICFGVISSSQASSPIAVRVIALDILELEQLFKNKWRNHEEACIQGLWWQKDTALGNKTREIS